MRIPIILFGLIVLAFLVISCAPATENSFIGEAASRGRAWLQCDDTDRTNPNDLASGRNIYLAGETRARYQDGARASVLAPKSVDKCVEKRVTKTVKGKRQVTLTATLTEYYCLQNNQIRPENVNCPLGCVASGPNAKKACVNPCGNGQRDAGETCSSCPQDASCNAAAGEVCRDGGCTLCGNEIEDAGETCSTCSLDAGCDVGFMCRAGECVVDLCGNGQLDEGETCALCPADAAIDLANERDVCDNSDNNCNGRVDEDFNFQTDSNNCGRCGNVCPAGNSCQDGVCAPPEFVAVGSSGLVLTGSVRGDWPGAIIAGGPSLNAVQTLWPSHLQWAVGNAGKVFKRILGHNWEEVVVPWNQLLPGAVVPGLNSVYFLDEQIGWLVGDNGIILKTRTGGNVWVLQSLPANQPAVPLQAVFGIDRQRAVVVGSQGKIFRTANGGENWLSTTTGVETDLWDVFMTSSLNGWAVGSEGTVLYTTNSGDTWTVRTPVIDDIQSKYLYGIYFVDQNTGWIVGSDGFILHTIDGGAQWQIQGQGVTSYVLTEVYFVNAQRGCAVGAQRTVICTSDGGLHWERRTPESNVLLSGISSS